MELRRWLRPHRHRLIFHLPQVVATLNQCNGERHKRFCAPGPRFSSLKRLISSLETAAPTPPHPADATNAVIPAFREESQFLRQQPCCFPETTPPPIAKATADDESRSE